MSPATASHSSTNTEFPEWIKLVTLRSFRGRLINNTKYYPLEPLASSDEHPDEDETQIPLELLEVVLRGLFGKNEACFLDRADVVLAAESRDHLRSLCGLLNGLVNVALLEEQDQEHSWQGAEVTTREYHKLDALLSVLLASEWPFNLATGGGGRTLFYAPSSKEANEAKKIVEEVDNWFRNQFRPRLTDISPRPITSPLESDPEMHATEGTCAQSSTGRALDALLRLVHEKKSCGKEDHQVLVQLIDSGAFPDHPPEPGVNLFLSTCHSPGTAIETRHLWQEAQLLVREATEVGNPSDWKKTTAICDELKLPHGGKALCLKIHDGAVSVFDPPDTSTRRRARFRSRWPTTTLCDKIGKDLAFAAEIYGDTRPKEKLFGLEEKRSLAARLVLSMGQSLDSGLAVMAWDSTQVFFLSEDNHQTWHLGMRDYLAAVEDCYDYGLELRRMAARSRGHAGHLYTQIVRRIRQAPVLRRAASGPGLAESQAKYQAFDQPWSLPTSGNYETMFDHPPSTPTHVEAHRVPPQQYPRRVLYDSQDSNEDPTASRKWIDDFINFRKSIIPTFDPDTTKRVRITVIDTGIDDTQPYIRRGGWRSHRQEPSKTPLPLFKDFTATNSTDECNPVDDDGHGTFIAGLILRLAPDVELSVARVIRDRQTMKEDTEIAWKIAKAIDHAVNTWEAEIISISFGLDGKSKPVHTAINLALYKNVIVLGAAGNFGNRRDVGYPASAERVFKIFATSHLDWGYDTNPPASSDSGYCFGILGLNVESTWPLKLRDKAKQVRNRSAEDPELWAVMSGTSFATPIAASLVAIAYQFYNENKRKIALRAHSEGFKSIAVVKAVLKAMSRPAGKGDKFNLLSPELGRDNVFRYDHPRGQDKISFYAKKLEDVIWASGQ
ncbi:hypothetical protein MAPG_02596 [Magnaporthiopsis poae ATCC 64411]|uniref:Uncharacterized protein n=1 Tax=Magnaporthiopsis poae (strain ATCC 64411 / 73-15) TaxID=644358 RepID=A0A0C4DRT0_MAGP6|nr:hypothetical protein MAPG_02596 [Magnaporthiopsis poae ATCC 64411]